MTPEKERRHNHAGRRESDPRNVAAGTLVAAATDGLFPRVSRKKVIEYLTLIVGLATIYTGLTTWVASRFATRAEVAPIKQRIDSLGTRVDTLESLRRRDAEADRRNNALFMGLVKLRCMEITDETAFLVGLPCDSLLTPRGAGRFPIPRPRNR